MDYRFVRSGYITDPHGHGLPVTIPTLHTPLCIVFGVFAEVSIHIVVHYLMDEMLKCVVSIMQG